MCINYILYPCALCMCAVQAGSTVWLHGFKFYGYSDNSGTFNNITLINS